MIASLPVSFVEEQANPKTRTSQGSRSMEDLSAPKPRHSVLCPERLLFAMRYGAWLVETIRASGHENRANRPDTRLHLTHQTQPIRTCKAGAIHTGQSDRLAFAVKPVQAHPVQELPRLSRCNRTSAGTPSAIRLYLGLRYVARRDPNEQRPERRAREA